MSGKDFIITINTVIIITATQMPASREKYIIKNIYYNNYKRTKSKW